MPRRGLLGPPNHTPTLAYQETAAAAPRSATQGCSCSADAPKSRSTTCLTAQRDRENADQTALGMALFSLKGEVTRSTPRSSRRKAALMPRAGLTASAVTVLSVLAMAVLTT
jgi:hypothetical protein